MAVDTDTVQETEATTEQAAADSTLEQEVVAAEAVAETTPEPEAKAAETTTEAPATADATASIPGWDHDRQRRDEEAAEKRKELIRKEVAQQVAEVLALNGATTDQKQAIDDGADIQKLLDDAERLSDEAQKKAEEDPYESAKLSAAAAKAATQANRKMLALNTQQAAVLKAREADEVRKATISAEWQEFQKRNPDIPVKDAQTLADECYLKAADGGYEGKNLRTRANEIFLEKLPTLKKSSTHAKPVPQTTKPKTATSASVSKPAGTKVTPSGSGVRPSAQQMGDAAAVLGKQLRGH